MTKPDLQTLRGPRVPAILAWVGRCVELHTMTLRVCEDCRGKLGACDAHPLARRPRLGDTYACSLLSPNGPRTAPAPLGPSPSLWSLFTACAEDLRPLLDRTAPVDMGHSRRVATLAVRVGLELGMAPPAGQGLFLAGLLHDVGKCAVEPGIWRKPAALTAAEWAQVREHPVLAARIVSTAAGGAAVVAAVRGHHERLDGGGYPDGLQGTMIPPVARLIAVCDAYDAMASPRPYRQAMPVEAALGELGQCAGSQLDPECVEALFAALGARWARRRAA